ncbi:alpha/beta fold hydrolase [Actinokineospora iranica]|uniref:Pimeloyl-ACP methyl ester carboxylesterase n=1 Tax=Actinokineospora iranica TaxID=1271860 RepID=A0A1G6Z290_9PSEU|nr:alpha/beta fold hydrolase [Actinokineospora iranica]SDD96413.1 Pimeloyl-ACP methyl ester carboxylesterase [Actinokineospora iranica]
MATGMVVVDDGELSYEIQGAGSPVVLLHAGVLTGRMWDDQVARLARQHTVVRYDARGHGASATPRKPFAHYEDLRRLFAALGIERAALVGLSLGARTSIDFALAYPHLVDRLLLAAPGISGMTLRDPFILGQLARLTEAAEAGDTGAAVECVMRMWVDGPHRLPEETDRTTRDLCHGLMTDTIARHGAAAMTLATELGAIDRVAELTAPTLLLVGDLDSSDIHAVADLVASKAPDAGKQVVPGAGHMVNLDRRAEFDRALLGFLNGSVH